MVAKHLIRERLFINCGYKDGDISTNMKFSEQLQIILGKENYENWFNLNFNDIEKLSDNWQFFIWGKGDISYD